MLKLFSYRALMKQLDSHFIYVNGWKAFDIEKNKYYKGSKWRKLGRVYKTDFFEKYKKYIN